MKCIKIDDNQYNRIFLQEGVDWHLNGGNTVDLSINHKRDNNSNKGMNSVDTRVFGTKDDILNGKMTNLDGSENLRNKSLSQYYTSKKAALEFFQKVIDYVRSGRSGDLPYVEGLDNVTWNKVNGWFQRGDSDNKIIDACMKAINRTSGASSQVISTYDRVNNAGNDDKVARYLTGIVPSTNVRYISLFSMADFNFSDAIKHGKIRQNGNTDKLFGISKDERALDTQGNLKGIDVTYDGYVRPNVAQNFSLNGVGKDHFKQQYGYGSKNGYSSINEFLDKSVMYASYALKEEGFTPDVIVSAPSSSKFNEYYCTNLSRKLGVEYIKDFFERNMVNVRFDDGRDVQAMREQGFSEKDVVEFSSQVKNIAYKEIAYLVSEPLRQFVYSNRDLFSYIPLVKSSREKFNVEDVIIALSTHTFQVIANYMQTNDMLTKHLVQNFYNEKSIYKSTKYDYQYLVSQIQDRIGKRTMKVLMEQVYMLVQKYSDQLKENGYKLRFDVKRFKITQIKKNFRPFLHNVYIVADKYVNENGKLLTRLKNAKFLIFDEDINSGATLKLAIDALQEKIPSSGSDNILCLVNAYSGSGF